MQHNGNTHRPHPPNFGSRSALDWYGRIGEIIQHTDLPTLPAVLVESIKQVVDFEHAAIFGYPERRRPVFLFDGFGSGQRRSSVAPYLKGSYRADPFYAACAREVEPGLYRMQDLAPRPPAADGGGDDHVSPCISEEPGFLSEEIGFFARNEHGTYIVLSLMRSHTSPPFSSAEFSWLGRVTPVILAAMQHYWRDLGALEADGPSAASLTHYVDTAFDSFGASVLSPREQEVARYVLRGHSSVSIAGNLRINVATVKIHRRNIYSKLNISSQSELFALFIDLLSVHGPREPEAARSL